MLSAHVFFQTMRLSKTSLAHITFVRFLVRVNTRVLCQSTRLTKSFIAHITFVRFLVRVNTHVPFQTTRLSKTLLAHITFVRFLVRVSTHVYSQTGWTIKHLLANIALVLPSLSLPSFRRRRLFFSYLIALLIIRYSQTQQHRSSCSSLSLSHSLLLRSTRNHHRLRVFRSFRMFILSSRGHYSLRDARETKVRLFPAFL